MTVLAKRITDRTTELTEAIKRRPPNLVDLYAAAQQHIRQLRSDAYYAYLNNQNKRSAALDREAFAMAKRVPLEYRL